MGNLVRKILRRAIPNPAPVAVISFELDYYSSTIQAFRLFEANQKRFVGSSTGMS